MFTKGEWKYGFNPGVTGPTSAVVPSPVCGGKDWPYRTVTVGTETIAIVPAQDEKRQFGGRGTPNENEMISNAQLIASAPDLYEALTLTRNNLQTLSDGALHYKKTFSANLVVLNQAIAKAEGK